MQKLNSVKGTKDLFGKTILEHDYVLKNFEDVCVFNNFKKISTPILEHENIFVKTLGVSSDIISCPSCARQNFNVISTVGELEKRLEHITTPMTLSVIGCVVNGPGEAKETDIGLTGGKNHQIYLDGEKHHILREGNMIDHLVDLCEKKQKELLSKS